MAIDRVVTRWSPRIGTALLAGVALGLSLLPPAAALPAATSSDSHPSIGRSAAGSCQVVVPRRVVLRAVGIQQPYSVKARWGSCPAWVISYGYNTWLPDYDGHPLTWRFRRTSGPAVAPALRNFAFRDLPLTAFDSAAPAVGDVGTGGDYGFLMPGTYRYDHALTFAADMENNLAGVDLTASNGFVARYWAGAALTVARTGRTTTVAVVGRRDGPLVTPRPGYLYVHPGYKVAASGARVQVRRDGKVLTTLRLNARGRATWTFRDTAGRHRYAVVMLATPWNWSAAAVRVR